MAQTCDYSHHKNVFHKFANLERLFGQLSGTLTSLALSTENCDDEGRKNCTGRSCTGEELYRG